MLRQLFLLVLGFRLAVPLALSHLDLELANRTCDGKSSCEGWDDSAAPLADWRDRNCMCDAQCASYGDCCLDSRHFELAEQRRALTSFSCVELRQFGGIYMKTGCPPSWEDKAVRALCEPGGDRDPSDPLAALPVTSPDTGRTYRNAYCALCHGETAIDLWKPRLECASLGYTHNYTRDKVSQNLYFDDQKDSWGLLTEDNKFHPCTIDPVIPDSSASKIRRCQANTIKSCAINWTNVEVRNRCEAYTSLVYEGNYGFRNPHCAVCNNVPLQYLQCNRISFRDIYNKDFSPVAFTVLFDLTGGKTAVGKKRPCSDNQVFDPFFRKCREILNDIANNIKDKYSHSDLNDKYSDMNTTDVLIINRDDTSRFNNTYLFNDSINSVEFLQSGADSHDECLKILLEKDEYILDRNHTNVFVPAYGQTYGADSFVVRKDGTMELCIKDDFGTRLVDKFGPYMGYITFAGLGVSIIFLLLHLTAFVLLPELRNLSGKNLACLCLSLLVAYSTFMAGQLLVDYPCYINALVMYYSFLASFSWMLTMSFDVWRTLRLATAELRVSSGKQWRKFTLYSLWSWTAPAIILISSMLIDSSPKDAVSRDLRPEFGVYSCWFGQRKALLIFFALPIGVVMLLNIVFFASSAHMIYSTSSTTRFTASSGTQRDFRLYVRLALVMGITWTIGLVAGTLDIEGLWYAFIALNTLQGLFIFLAFTCTDKVIRGLAGRQADGRPLRPPSFSWSGASTDSTHKSHIGSEHGHTDTLY
ncbi:uncharacterized protein LOC111061963 isoform X3 [Nilaparvata lugens]|uniref:uncharacterized protein LOC111061963 isoform X1 n=1 Tax=Nilaparvata lugens TaxID=108931 RepID=UPI00193DF651|nr:uncharacterized protein LOC111061963 isoform X1 [Nilaparvata lugens]XP_039292825.1 uncharacterized protein LOC111061963 isoform X3 [Nilaparvata lugens]